jgi:hypothetical protein
VIKKLHVNAVLAVVGTGDVAVRCLRSPGERRGHPMVHLLSDLWRLMAEARKSLLEVLDDRFWEECGRDLR